MDGDSWITRIIPSSIHNFRDSITETHEETWNWGEYSNNSEIREEFEFPLSIDLYIPHILRNLGFGKFDTKKLRDMEMIVHSAPRLIGADSYSKCWVSGIIDPAPKKLDREA